jgi:hypothetical protein
MRPEPNDVPYDFVVLASMLTPVREPPAEGLRRDVIKLSNKYR